MNFFRRLTAELPGELLAAQVAATSRHSEANPPAEDGPTREGKAGESEFVPAPEYPEIWAALAVLSSTPGVIDHTTAGLPAPAHHSEGEN